MEYKKLDAHFHSSHAYTQLMLFDGGMCVGVGWDEGIKICLNLAVSHSLSTLFPVNSLNSLVVYVTHNVDKSETTFKCK